MEEGLGSGSVVKKKSSSGCLIIKKKGDGRPGVGSSSVSHREKKRFSMVLTDLGSSDESLDPSRQKIDKLHNGSAVNKNNIVVEKSCFGRNGELERDRKRSRLGLYDFDEYNDFDERKMRNDYMVAESESQRQFRSGSSSKDIVYKRRHSYFKNASDLPGGKDKRIEYGHKSEAEDDEAHLPISSLREKFLQVSDEPIRLQGKNGVLKVMVNKKTKLCLSHTSYDYQEAEDRKCLSSEDLMKKNVLAQHSLHSNVKRLGKPVSYARLEETELKQRKSLSTNSSKAADMGIGDTETSLMLGIRSTSGQACGSVKRVKNEGKSSPPTESIKTIRGKEGKVDKGSGTEKQLLRERIRTMLVSAGWTIDYRPRRNRDYLDAVYINPTGTAYWSIIKAYDAFQKQQEEENASKKSGKYSSQFIPLSEEILSKLTRRTRKKMEKEVKKKRRDDNGSKIAEKAAVRLSEGVDSDQHEAKLSFYAKQNGKLQRGRSREAGHVIGDDSSDKLYNGMPGRESIEECVATNPRVIQGRKSRKIGRCTLLVRNSDKGQNSESSGFVSYAGRRTLLAWLIDSGTVRLSEKVQYMNRRRTKVLLEGWITRDGIHCGCCSKILTVSKFELHAGTKHRQPLQNIILESGNSLLQCQIDAWNRQEESERLSFHSIDVDGDDPNDDTCGICGDGGDLICCDGCPSTFHQNCLGIQVLPTGDWHCPNCACKFCGNANMSIAEQNSKTVSSLQICSLCEKQYHGSCRVEMDGLSADSTNAPTSFCGKKCQELFDRLQKLIGVKHELEAGFSWSLIHQTNPELDVSHRGFSQRVECNSKLAVALSIMDECFLPIIDRRSGINLIHNVLYNCGSNFSRLNYSGFYTAVLERGDELISAASIRIHGIQLAEMPFIGTRHIYRRQGMCRRLLCAIELVLCSLKVEKLIIPAIAEHMHTWTAVFGFHLLEESHKQEMRSMNMLVFPGTDMLQKLLVKQKNSEENIAPSSVVKFVDLKDKHISLYDSGEKLDLESSFGQHHHMGDDAGFCHVDDLNEEVTAVESGSETPSVPSVDGAGMTSYVSRESELQFSRKDTISTKSQSFGKLAEYSATCPLAWGATALAPEVENHVADSMVTDNIQSNADCFTGDAHEANAKASGGNSVPDTLEGTSTRDIIEVANENQKPVFRSTVHGTDESAVLSNVDLNDQNQGKLQVASEAASDAEVAACIGNIQCSTGGSGGDDHRMIVKGVDPVPGSLVEISASGTPERVTENHSAQFKSELNQSSTLNMGSEPNASMEHFSDAEVASDMKVDDYTESSAVSAS